MLDKDMIVHLITDDIYIDIKFTAFSGGGPGGGFSYQRSTEPDLGIKYLKTKKRLKLYPNPSMGFIQFANFSERETVKIYDVLGNLVIEKIISNQEKIDIQTLTKGLYCVRFKNGSSVNFIKG